MTNFIGKHMVLDIIVKDKITLNNETSVATYLHRMTDITNMTLIVAPQTFRFPFSNEYKRFVEKCVSQGINHPLIEDAIEKLKYRENEDSGITGICIFSESHMSFHGWDEKSYAGIDIFSCKDFDSEKVLDFTKLYFDCEKINYCEILRYAGEPAKVIQSIVK